jgi:hypothetical protein
MRLSLLVAALAAAMATVLPVAAARAQTAPAAAQPAPAADPWNAGTLPPGLAPPALDPSAVAAYYLRKKEMFIGMGLQYLLPGMGQLYAEHAAGALVTWGCMAAGVGLVVWDIPRVAEGQRHAGYALAGGIVSIAAGTIYGFVDVYHSVRRFNRELHQRYRLPASLSLDLGGVPTPAGDVALGPRLAFAF